MWFKFKRAGLWPSILATEWNLNRTEATANVSIFMAATVDPAALCN